MAVDPSAALAQAGLARMEQADGNLAAAEDLARAALSADPEEADVLYLAADLALARGDLDEAISYFQTIKDIKPVNPFVRVPLSRALVTAGRLDEAAEELDWVLSRVSATRGALSARPCGLPTKRLHKSRPIVE